MHTVEIYAPESNYIRTKTHHLYNTHLTAKELYIKLTLSFNLDYYADTNKTGYLQQYDRIMRSLDDGGNIVKERWLQKIASDDFHYLMASNLLGFEYDCLDSETERLAKIKNAICDGVEHHKNTKRLVAEAKNEMAFSRNNFN